jgi:hypothetical protein
MLVLLLLLSLWLSASALRRLFSGEMEAEPRRPFLQVSEFFLSALLQEFGNLALLFFELSEGRSYGVH